MYYSKTIIVGRVGRDPEFKEVGDGLCKFSVAVSESWKDKSGEWQEKTDWYDVNLWGKTASYMMEKLYKGCQVLVSGKMESRKHDDKVYWSLKPDMYGGVKVLTPKKDGVEVGQAKPVDDDELPF